MGQSIERKVCKGLEKTQRDTQQETKRYPTTKRESPARTREKKRGTREGAGPILGSDKTSEEEEENGGTTREEDATSRCIPAGVQGHHMDYSGTMVRA